VDLLLARTNGPARKNPVDDSPGFEERAGCGRGVAIQERVVKPAMADCSSSRSSRDVEIEIASEHSDIRPALSMGFSP